MARIFLYHPPSAELGCYALDRGFHHTNVIVRHALVGLFIVERNHLLLQQPIQSFRIGPCAIALRGLHRQNPSR